jgi:hypothetical protein
LGQLIFKYFERGRLSQSTQLAAIAKVKRYLMLAFPS